MQPTALLDTVTAISSVIAELNCAYVVMPLYPCLHPELVSAWAVLAKPVRPEWETLEV